MKAIGTAAISHAGALPVGAIWAAGLFSGLFWLVMGPHRCGELDCQNHESAGGAGAYHGFRALSSSARGSRL